MDWEARLTKARAQREMLLRERGPKKGGGPKVVDRRQRPGAAGPAKARPIPVADDQVSPSADKPVAAHGGRRRTLALAGLGIAALVAGLAAVSPILFAPGEEILPVAEEAVASAPATSDAEPVAAPTVPTGQEQTASVAAPQGPTGKEQTASVAAPQGPTGQEQTASEISPQPSEPPSVMADPATIMSAPDVASGPDVPRSMDAAAQGPREIATLDAPRIDTSHGIDTQRTASLTVPVPQGAPPAPSLAVSVLSLEPGEIESPETRAGSIQLVSSDAGFEALPAEPVLRRAGQRLSPIGAPRTESGLVAASSPQRPALLAALGIAAVELATESGPGLDLGFSGDRLVLAAQPGMLMAAPAPGEPAGADPVPPAPIIAGASGMQVLIFAASTVDEEAVAGAQGVAEGFGLPILQVTRVGYRISENQVRFYDETSAAAANRLAADIGAVARDFTGSNADPPEGTLEIYLAGEAPEAPPPRPVASARPPAAQPALSPTERLRESVISRLRAGASP